MNVFLSGIAFTEVDVEIASTFCFCVGKILSVIE